MFSKILIANRGEIAVRIIRACRELGVKNVVVHSEADRNSLAVTYADESFCVGPAPTSKSYLNIPNIVTAALVTGCDAIHPGYGFLSENQYFAEICEKCDVTFIGPHPDIISAMSDKSVARARMKEAGLPVLPGTDKALRSVEEAQELANDVGYPVILKAAAGGGGRGMRVVRDDAELTGAFPTAQAESQSAFGSAQLYLEKYLEHCRHIEVQVMGDKYGTVVHLGERDCSIQRRHQKIIEEAPSVALSEKDRAHLGALAVLGAASINYSNAGTLEFLRGADGEFYFLEMNTRIQVEHGVTELVTGIDLVKEQIRVASGERLSFSQEDVKLTGHSIECRVNAEDPFNGFAPKYGIVNEFHAPGGPGVRVDSHLYSGYSIPMHYDSLLAKVMAWGATREEAISRMAGALEETRVGGVSTTLPFLRAVMQEPHFRSGDVFTDYIGTIDVVSLMSQRPTPRIIQLAGAP